MTIANLPKHIISFTHNVKNSLNRKRQSIVNGSILLVAVILITLLIAPSRKIPTRNYKAGDIASETVRIQENMNIVDIEKTENAKREAENAVVAIYDYDDQMIESAIEKLSTAFGHMRKAYIQDIVPLVKIGGPSSAEVKKQWISLHPYFNEITGIDFPEKYFLAISRTNFGNSLKEKLIKIMGSLEKWKIVSDMNSLKAEIPKGIVIRNIETAGESGEKYIKEFSNFLDLDHARKLVTDRSQPILKGYKPYLKKSVLALANSFVRPNIFINMQLTSRKIEEAMLNVKPVTIPIQKNEVIVRAGDRITSRHKVILDGLKRAQREISTLEMKVGVAVIAFLIIFLTYTFAKAYIRKFSPKTKDLVFLFATTLMTILLAKLFIAISNTLGDKFTILSSPTFRFAIPVATSAMLVRFAINSETAIVFSFIISLFMGYMFEGGGVSFAIYCFIASVFGAYKIAYSKTKFDLMKAGIMTGVISALTAIFLEMIGGRVFSGGYSDLGTVSLMALSSGVFIALILPTLSTIVEASGYLTDIRLIELSNFNNPLLNKLALVAPGTYHHSRVVAQLVEVASGSIHANPLLSQVLAFYHDIGKLKQPEYFIENQGTGENKHDDLKPSMSKMILISHVKDGVEMAKDAKVPKEIIDAIEQHHGTSLISFFYKKAKDQENPDVEHIDESEYRYPGPKPQTREIGLLMLADAVEAATKSLVDPTPAQIQGVIQKVFNKTFSDGQLEDCELTLKDLHKIAAAFFRVLVSVYKARINYPELPPKEGHKKKTNGDTHSKQTKADKVKDRGDKENDKGNLKRIGIDKQ